MKSRRILRWCISLVVIVVVAVSGYYYLHQQASDRVRVEMLRVVSDMSVPADAHEEIRRRLSKPHDQAFDNALSISFGHGRKFDHIAYFKQVFDEVIDSYRAEGRDDLANSLDDDRQYFSFDVTEN